MSKQSIYRTPQTVTGELGVSSATLRRWSEEFSEYLSPEAGSTQGGSHRRYTDDDLDTLGMIKELMKNGMTYEQVRQQLATWLATRSKQVANSSLSQTVDDFDEDSMVEPEQNEETGLIASNGNESAAVAFLNNTLTTLSDTQKSILNSQAANRELLGVVIQDNFNLKEENNRLRERVLDVERNLSQVRQEEEWRREALRQELDAKIATVQRIASEAITVAHSTEAPDIKAVKTKPGCLGGLFGGGDMQIITLPRRQKQKQAQRGQPTELPPMAPPPHPSAPQQVPPIHPKPTRPPE